MQTQTPNKYRQTSNIPKTLGTGNVISVVSDRLLSDGPDANGKVNKFEAEIVRYSDYYPFGFEMDGREGSYAVYRYGFNGMEKDDEVTNSTSHYDFGTRIYDSRLGRWLAVDPLAGKYPDLSSYAFVSNSPLQYIDPDGCQLKPSNIEAQEAMESLLEKYDPDDKGLFGIYPIGKKAQLFQVKKDFKMRDFKKKAKELGLKKGSEDYKSAKNLFKLMKTDDIYEVAVVGLESTREEDPDYDIYTMNDDSDTFIKSLEDGYPTQGEIASFLGKGKPNGNGFGFFENKNIDIGSSVKGILYINAEHSDYSSEFDTNNDDKLQNNLQEGLNELSKAVENE